MPPQFGKGLAVGRAAQEGVNPVARALMEYALGEQGYELIGTSAPGSVFKPELFPGLEIPIDDFWA